MRQGVVGDRLAGGQRRDGPAKQHGASIVAALAYGREAVQQQVGHCRPGIRHLRHRADRPQELGQPGAGMAEFLRAVRSVPKVADSRATVADLLLDGFAAVGERRYDAGAVLLRRAIAPLAAGQPIPDDALPHLMAVGQAAGLLYDDSARYQMEKRWVAELRGRGAIAALLTALGI